MNNSNTKPVARLAAGTKVAVINCVGTFTVIDRIAPNMYSLKRDRDGGIISQGIHRSQLTTADGRKRI